MPESEARRQLRQRWDELSATRLPPPLKGDPEAEELRGDLIGYDSHVAGVVSRVLQQMPVPGEWLAPRRDLRRRAEALAVARRATDAAEAAGRYVSYLAALDELLTLATRVEGPPG